MGVRISSRVAQATALVLLSYAVIYLYLRPLSRGFLVPPSPSALPEVGSKTEVVESQPELPDKVVVVGHLRNESIEWIAENLPDWQHAIYTVDDPDASLKPPTNKGHEAMVYLTYIIDHYDKLPSTVVFLHAHRDGYPRAWHNDADNYDNVNSVQNLRIDYVQNTGYANLRCIHIPGCPDEIRPFRENKSEDKPHEIAFAEAWQAIFGRDVPTPEIIAVPCCSQWAASRAQILQRKKEEYIRYRQWLLDTPLDDATSGRVLEYLWHIFMMQDPVYCPDIGQCYCDVYGRCG
ncbi:hypothetical protein F5884DRAFT_674713 [Xylogone sp. PMI_703]|nr:hypothetical protein F5884DRAFT_674713 [Xylogone sp. PMI_703]